jgi:RNA polymerase-binding transcription factor DksA
MSRRKRFTRNLGRKLSAPLPRRTTTEWVRFEHANEPYGLFSYLEDAFELLNDADRKSLLALRDWFNEHLDAPDKLSEGRFWFCAEAEDHIAQARRLAEVVKSAGIPIEERRTSRVPGAIRWHDRDQVAVLTYRDTPQPRGRS